MNRDFQIANKASREKMRALVESMSDEQLALPTVAGWTIASFERNEHREYHIREINEALSNAKKL
jgi:hypothetical protein